MINCSPLRFALCLAVAGAVAAPVAAFADHHEADASSTREAVATPARMPTDGTLSVEGTGIQEIEASARSATGADTESVEGTGVMQTGAQSGQADGTRSVEGTGFLRAAPSDPGADTESVEGTGLMDATAPQTAPATVQEAAPAVVDPNVDGND